MVGGLCARLVGQIKQLIERLNPAPYPLVLVWVGTTDKTLDSTLTLVYGPLTDGFPCLGVRINAHHLDFLAVGIGSPSTAMVWVVSIFLLKPLADSDRFIK